LFIYTIKGEPMHKHEMHTVPVQDAVGALETHLINGLMSQDIPSRLREHGYNELKERPRPGFLKMLIDQLNSFLVIILIVAAVVSLLLGEIVDASAIMAIVVLNAIIGVVQESKAEQAIAALKKMATPNAAVIRDGRQCAIPTRELVPGDIVLLEAGNYVPADLRLIESINLKVDEASLTGESAPVHKNAAVVLDKDIPIGDRKNSAFMGTLVTYGRGKGLVTSTGMHTQIGMIADMIQSYDEEQTPLQQKLDQLGKWLGTICLAICGGIFVIGIFRDTHPSMILTNGILAYLQTEEKAIIELFMTAVSLAIAAVPEGLAAIVTICLALGMQKMVKRHALVRKLPVVETLGCATVICSDKTGTLTQNEMTVVRGWATGRVFQVTGTGYSPDGQFSYDGESLSLPLPTAISLLLQGALLSNDAHLEQSGKDAGKLTWRMIGDPTEGALVTVAAKAGLWRDEIEKDMPRVAEIPFDSERKRMTTIHQLNNGHQLYLNWEHSPFVAFVKGAPDILLERCDNILLDGHTHALTDDCRKQILAANEDMARQALRVLGVAMRSVSDIAETPTPEVVEKNLTFLGLVGMIDPARPEVKAAVQIAHGAGLKSVMVTGDYKETAKAIAEEIHLLSPGGKVLTGADLDEIDAPRLAEMVEQVDIFARVSPQHKVKIVEAFKARGHVVAMTGDGVNDAPALKRANIGVAMGITGTDVAKETADMVLTDDNYASIVAAIEEGRTIYSNIRKFVFYLLACNVGEILIIFIAMLAGLPIPLSPIMLLWLNLATDGAPAIALGLEKGDPDIMRRPPRPTREPVVNRDMLTGIVVVSIADTIAVLSAFVITLGRFPGHLEAAQTAAFATLVCSELLRSYTSRSEYYSIFAIGVFSNRWMIIATGMSVLLLLVAIYVPFLQLIFGTYPLSLADWAFLSPFFLLAPIAAELTKAYLRRTAATHRHVGI
jgi:P-type Ca2+ transporter type 2C